MEESHTSVVGMREAVGGSGGIFALPAHAMAHCLTTPEPNLEIPKGDQGEAAGNHGQGLVGDDKGGDET